MAQVPPAAGHVVAGVTYNAGLNPPGGVWPDDTGGHATGDPVLPVTFHSRYFAFFYCNATAFVASLVVIMMLLDRRVSGNHVGVTVLCSAMVLDLAYAAGSNRKHETTAYVVSLAGAVLVYIALQVVVGMFAMAAIKRWLVRLCRILPCRRSMEPAQHLRANVTHDHRVQYL
uniref:PGG domain-containing protein n=1 Tax=Oryza barthii TaxID=65489 RepID=A0A0D3GFJ6_9ORYZ